MRPYIRSPDTFLSNVVDIRRGGERSGCSFGSKPALAASVSSDDKEDGVVVVENDDDDDNVCRDMTTCRSLCIFFFER